MKVVCGKRVILCEVYNVSCRIVSVQQGKYLRIWYQTLTYMYEIFKYNNKVL